MKTWAATVGGLLLLGSLAHGEEKPRKPKKPAKEPAPTVSRHKATIGGQTIEYVATAGRLAMKDEKGKDVAHLFHVAYTRANTTAKTRPVTFVFNGGPGSASLWLHLGCLGPKRVAMTDRGDPLPPPGRVVANADSWLDVTDLVFIDPVGTGYSRPAVGHKQTEFSGLEEDTKSVGEFIRLWVTRNKRWASPKFLAGESYGTTRAASLSGHLQGRYGMYLNGIVLVSSVLYFQTIRFGTGNDLPYILFLPTYTATAWYHGRLEGELPKLLAAAEHFALNEYMVALATGDELPPARRKAIAARIAALTALSVDFVERSNLRVSMGAFAKELLRAERRTIGRLDSRFKGIDRNAAGGRYDYDPAMAVISGPFSAAAKDYLRTELGYENDIQYRTLGGVGRWKMPEGRYANTAETLRKAMTQNKYLRVLIASGRYDLATPHFAADYTVSHLGLDETLRGNVTVRYYDAGHMMYIHAASRAKLKQDAAAFYATALASPPPPKKQ